MEFTCQCQSVRTDDLALWYDITSRWDGRGEKSSASARSFYRTANYLEAPKDSHKTFEKITSIEELDAILAENKGKRVLVDFYADWCTSCKEYEEITFADEAVKTQMDTFVLVQVDVTANDNAASAITKKFGLFGPPAILFFDEKGAQNKDATIIGFKEPAEFIQHLGAIQWEK